MRGGLPEAAATGVQLQDRKGEDARSEQDPLNLPSEEVEIAAFPSGPVDLPHRRS